MSSTIQGRHVSPTRPPGRIRSLFRTRTRKVVAIASSLVLVGGIAFAALFVLAKIQGSVSVTPIQLSWNSADVGDEELRPHVVSTTGDITCEVSTVANGSPGVRNLVIDVSTSWPGSSCTVSASLFKLQNEGDVRVQDITYTSNSDVVFTSGCGASIPFRPSQTTVGEIVTFTITVPGGTSGGTEQAGAEAGVRGVPSSEYVAGNCPQA